MDSFNEEKVREDILRLLQMDRDLHVYAPRINEDAIRNYITSRILKADQIYEDDEGFWVYTVKEPYDIVLGNSFLFLEDSLFLEEWYNACDKYVDSLKPRERYILSRYTRHGDEIVNSLLRNPDAFATNARIHDLLFEKMPEENLMLYAMQLIDMYDAGKHTDYLTHKGEILASEFQELVQMEQEYVGNVDHANLSAVVNRLVPLIQKYIEDLRDILHAAPRLPAPLQVFRATGTDYLRPHEAAEVKGFLSTSLDSTIGEDYPHNDYIYQIILQPGTPCLSVKNASKYYEEFEVLVDANCYAMSSRMVGKHCLQTDLSGTVDPAHIFIHPMNLQHRVRNVQIMGGPRHGGRSIAMRSMKFRKSIKSIKSRKSTKTTKSKMSVTRKSKRAIQSSRTRLRMKRWHERDHLPPRVEYGVPAHIQQRLLDAHKKMGTYFEKVAR